MKQSFYYNGTILTMEGHVPQYVEAVLVEDGVILAAGEKSVLERDLHGKANMVNLHGKTMLPGFVDAHSHLIAAACERLYLNAAPSPKGKCDSIELLIESMRAQCSTRSFGKRDWIIGMGYDHTVYPGRKHPDKHDLDRISESMPVCIVHVSGHLAVLNSKALEMLGITSETPDPAGGKMKRYPESMEPTGLLEETAFWNQTLMMKTPALPVMLRAIGETAKWYASFGITTAQEARCTERELQQLKLAGAFGLLPIDVACYLTPETSEQNLPRQSPVRNPYSMHVRRAGYKFFLDGSPQGETAWLTKPYYQVPEGKESGYSGEPAMTSEEVLKHIENCLERGWQLNVHVNGDAAIDQFLQCYEKALEKYPESQYLRPVLIHAQTIRKDQIKKCAELGIFISFFVDHVYYWGDYHFEQALGPERAVQISPLRTAVRAGVPVTIHQDTPVVEPNILFSVHNAVNRVSRKGRILGEQERISPYEALRTVTIQAACQIFEEEHKGSIRAGKDADFVILNQNPLTIEAEKIKDIKVLETIKRGRSILKGKR